MKLINRTDHPLQLGTCLPLVASEIHSSIPFTHSFKNGNGRESGEITGLFPLAVQLKSDACIAFTDASGCRALVIGFENLGHAFCGFEGVVEGGVVTQFKASCQYEGITLAPGKTLVVPTLLVGAGESLSELLQQYARQVAHRMGSRIRPVETGWCSWYYYYGTETEQDILDNVRLLADSPWRDRIRVIQIDDGWNLPKPGHPIVWGDWQPGPKFPRGMKAVADDIRAAGFLPGLWLAPFSAEPASTLYQQHPDWLIQGDTGPLPELDLTHPAALDFVSETFARVFDEWGFDYVKIDFLARAAWKGKRHNPDITSAQALRLGLERIRAAARDRFVLGCGAPMGPAVGLCDGMRIGSDVSSYWMLPLDLPRNPLGALCIKAAANDTLWRQWMHQIWWQNDPDCLVVRDFSSEPEKALLNGFSDTSFLKGVPQGLSDEEAAFWVRLVWLTGTMAILSEKLDLLPENRRQLLGPALSLTEHPAHLVDWFERPLVYVLKSASPAVFGVFNLGDQTETLAIPAAKLGLPGRWRLKEWLSGEVITGFGTMAVLPPLPPHAGRVWVVC
jgi:alpha-galactosidase